MSCLMIDDEVAAGLVPGGGVEIKIITGTTPSSLNTFGVVADFPTGWSANNTYVAGYICLNHNGQWGSNAPEINVIATESIGIRVRVSLDNYANKTIKVMLARELTA